MENNGVRARGSYADIDSIDSDLIQEWNLLIANEEARDELIRFVQLFYAKFFFVLPLW